MFKSIFTYELHYNSRKVVNLIFFLLFLGISYLIALVIGGTFTSATSDIGKLHMNSSLLISSLFSIIIYWTLLLFPSIVGDAIYRDFRTESYSLFFTKPISKFGYLAGRFLGSIATLAIILLGFELGFLIGTLMPWINQDLKGPLNLLYYINDYFLFLLPNVILMGSIVFCAATLSRNILFTYIVCILFYVIKAVAASLLSKIDNHTLSALLDPFGSEAISIYTRYWSVAEQNNNLLPLKGIILYNRLLWLGISAILFLFTYLRFELKYADGISWFRKRKASLNEEFTPIVKNKITESSLSKSSNNIWSQFKFELKFEYLSIVKSIPFIIFLLIGIGLIILTSTQLDDMYGTSIYPLTSRIIPLTQGAFNLVLVIFIIYFSGEIVWKERSLRINQVYDAMPFPSWLPLISKLSAFFLVQLSILGCAGLCGIGIQLFHGFYQIEFDLYFKMLLLESWYFILFSALAFSTQVLVNNKYIAYVFVIGIFVFLQFAGLMGLNQPIYLYGADSGYLYSDMNKFGHFMYSLFIHKIYWTSFAGILVVIAILFWQRGMDTRFSIRRKIAVARLNKKLGLVIVLCTILFLAFGSFIFYNTHILHAYKTNFESEEQIAQFEKKYKKYEQLVQPRITDVVLDAAIYPKERAATFIGYYWMKNKSKSPINEVHLNLNAYERIVKLQFSKPCDLSLNDTDNGYRIYKLKQSMMPGDSMRLDFDLRLAVKGFKYSGGSSASVLYNGTFINNQSSLPSIGYPEAGELSDDKTRIKHGLKPKDLLPPATDTNGAKMNYIANDADWINFEATVSTTEDQIGIAPGYLQKEWTKEGRKYFHYKMDTKILNFYSILSANYTVLNDSWTSPEGKKVKIQIFYQEGQTYDLDMMVKGIKKTLAYCSKNFSLYQYHQVRIIEFPRYASFAQSFPNTIPFSESIGFIAKVDPNNPNDIAYPFYVTCHEVAHQWWGHQVIGAMVKGSTLMCESMAQYTSLMVMEKEYGRNMIEKFLKYEMDIYLRSRGMEKKGEESLEDVEQQSYVYYQKGGIAMYALRDYIGEDSLNQALKRYVAAVAFHGPPYTNSREFLKYIRSACPDSLQYLISDMFEKITFYENRTVKAESVKLPNGKYRVDLEVKIAKKYSDKLGNEKSAKVDDYIEVGVYGVSKDPIHPVFLSLKKMKLTDKTSKLSIIVDAKPSEAGLDPRHLLIDRDIDDNVIQVTDHAEIVSKNK